MPIYTPVDKTSGANCEHAKVYVGSVRQSGLYQGLRRQKTGDTRSVHHVSVNQVCIKVCGAIGISADTVRIWSVRQSGLYQGLRLGLDIYNNRNDDGVRQSGLYQGLRRLWTQADRVGRLVSVNQVCIKVCGATSCKKCNARKSVRQSGLYQGLRLKSGADHPSFSACPSIRFVSRSAACTTWEVSAFLVVSVNQVCIKVCGRARAPRMFSTNCVRQSGLYQGLRRHARNRRDRQG